ncbi:MAG: GatB/YqeY domain-containing protein [bacterium]
MSETIQARLDAQLKDAMRARDSQRLIAVRMLKARMGETITAKGFSGTVDDALWIQVMSAYLKQQEKGLEQFEQAGAGDSEPAAQMRFEMAFIRPFLPAKADEATVRAWVAEAITGLGGPGKAKLGAVMGAIMKAHKDEVEAGSLRALIEAELAAG